MAENVSELQESAVKWAREEDNRLGTGDGSRAERILYQKRKHFVTLLSRCYA